MHTGVGFLYLFIMFTDPHFTFQLSFSQQKFASKPAKNQAGGITFIPQNVTIDGALQKITAGQAVCYSFSTAKQDGIITISDKTKENFLSTSTVLYDFDKMEKDLEEYIPSLPFPPSFAYPTYSDGQDGLHGFRLGFVFTEAVESEEAFNSLYYAIAQANGFVKEKAGEHGGWDERAVNQMYYGTYPTASIYNSGKIYCQHDFRRFVRTSSKTETTVFDRVASRDNHDSFVGSATNDFNKQGRYIEPEFYSTFMRLPVRDFLAKYKNRYFPNYKASLETPLILDESKMFLRYPENYYCVFYKRRGKKTLKWRPGEDRKSKLWITAHIMLTNVPSMSIENLLFNLAQEFDWNYDNSDRKITKKVLVQTAVNTFNRRRHLKSSKHGQFKVYKPYWREQGITPYEAKPIIQRYLKAKEIGQYIDPLLTRKENLEVLHKNGIDISDKTLQRMVSRGDIKIIGGRPPRAYLSCCPDADTILELIRGNETITLTEIAESLGVSKPTVNRRIKAMKGKMIDREGNNRTGRWIILPEFQDYADHKKVDNAMVNEDCSIPAENVNNVSQNDSELCIASWETNQSNPTELASGIQKTMDCDGCKIIADGAEQNHEQVILRQAPTPLIIESIVRRTG